MSIEVHTKEKTIYQCSKCFRVIAVSDKEWLASINDMCPYCQSNDTLVELTNVITEVDVC